MAKKRKTTRRKKAAAASIGLTTEQVCATTDPRVRDLTAQVSADGGAVLGSYSDPFGGTCVMLVVCCPSIVSSPRRTSAIRPRRTSRS